MALFSNLAASRSRPAAPEAAPLTPLEPSLNSGPFFEVEDSILLRVLVQVLVSIGILATDLAAADVVDRSGISLWAIPLSWVGAFWSWQHRRKRNIATKFMIAIGMLLALVFFFNALLSRMNDTRLVLAELLIQLQVLHSFDLPRRRDLGYSIVIGLILLSVAATLSQTFTFAPFLLAFLVVVLPILVLDYRSRLGLLGQRRLVLSGGKPTARWWHFPELTPQRLLGFLLMTVALGLGVFAVLPRLPGYQLQTFPVSAPIAIEGQFDARQIINPGYVSGPTGGGRFDEAGDASGAGVGQVRGRGAGEAGVMDDTFYYGFNTEINQNLRGQMTPRIVMRVRSQAKGFWRVLGFDRYTGQGWEISRNEEAEILERPFWSPQFFLPRFLTQAPTKEIVQTYTIVADLPNLIPAMAVPERLYFPTDQVAIDAEGGLRSPVNLSDGLTYTVVSNVLLRDRTALGKAQGTYPPGLQTYYLQLPNTISPKIRQHTEAILAKSSKPLTSHYEKALYLAQYLKQTYHIQPDIPYLQENEDLVEAFLFRFGGGYPDHFSTTLTVMLRSIGIPARLAVGFGAGEFNPFTGYYIVRNTDAYAITEVYFPDYGWFGFDPIPGHELIPPSPEEDYTFSVLKQFWQWVASWLPPPITAIITGVLRVLATVLVQAIGWFLGQFSRGWLGILTGLITAVAVSFLGWLGFQGWRQWRYHRWLTRLPAMESLYQQLLRWSASQGHRKRAAQTPLEFAQQLQSVYEPETAAMIAAITEAYVNWRYGGQTVDITELRRRFQQLRQRSLLGPAAIAKRPVVT
ncbi:transglutaminaseTgpA domain-containing protein [Trichothermofontia sp.]